MGFSLIPRNNKSIEQRIAQEVARQVGEILQIADTTKIAMNALADDHVHAENVVVKALAVAELVSTTTSISEAGNPEYAKFRQRRRKQFLISASELLEESDKLIIDAAVNNRRRQ